MQIGTLVRRNVGVVVLVVISIVCATVWLAVSAASDSNDSPSTSTTPWNPCKQFLDYEVAQDCYDGTCNSDDTATQMLCVSASEAYNQYSDEFWGQ